MKKIIALLVIILAFQSLQAQNYSKELKAINDYLKTFDNGYYGYLEIKDGYLYDRFKDGKNYCKAKLSGLNKAYEKESNRKVELSCKGSDNCLFSTFTNQYYNSFSFSQSTNFNTQELITLLNNLMDAYNNQEKPISTTSGTIQPQIGNNSNYQAELKKLNDYLKTFDNGYYGYFEVKDGYIYDRFKAGKYDKFKMEDIEGAVIQAQYSRVIFKCKSDNCIETDWKENGREEYIQFTQSGSFSYQELAELLNNFRDAFMKTISKSNVLTSTSLDVLAAKNREKSKALNNKLDESQGTSQLKNDINNQKYATPLSNLNLYLKSFNAETYRDVEVKNGKVYFNFFVYGANYNSSIGINELKKNTIITIGNSVGSFKIDEVKISCKGESKCFYSEYSKGTTDHFRFFSHTVTDFTKMKQLIGDFINALPDK